ncbi:hypothetical protein PVT67_15620 [Gallaecimonas kandeliae]|uniref:phage tail terminator protein n=1 Tax=Gallaecimonas kandeliae TaxID=3029055 RepID=UPI002649D053|nr:hypothetical protein [Gallaecimonas kandeliae]WKE65071.1 hypothetical protein PVT67_15620 [Gallaecimonas kandeliae]
MNEPFDVALVQQRLREQVAALTGGVCGGAEYAAVKSLRDFRHGSAYVVLASEINPNSPDSPAGARSRGVNQVLCTFGVITVARHQRGRTGEEALQEARPLIGAVRTALIGWVPEAPLRPVSWLKGDVMEYDANTLLWIDVFTTTHFITGGTA